LQTVTAEPACLKKKFKLSGFSGCPVGLSITVNPD